MTQTFSLKLPDGAVKTGLTAQDLGYALLRAWSGEWRSVRLSNGQWRLQCRSPEWYPTPVVVDAPNEEEANRLACAQIAFHPDWGLGFTIIPENPEPKAVEGLP